MARRSFCSFVALAVLLRACEISAKKAPQDRQQCGWTIITGTGRAGTSFLVRLLTLVGLPTGFLAGEANGISGSSIHAGLELSDVYEVGNMEKLSKTEGIEVFKSPFFGLPHVMPRWINDPRVHHVIVPIRSLEEVSKSRASHGGYRGGFWLGATDYKTMLEANRKYIADLLVGLTLAKREPILMAFPQHALDGAYAYSKLRPILECYNVSEETFNRTWTKASNPSLVGYSQKHPTALKGPNGAWEQVNPNLVGAFKTPPTVNPKFLGSPVAQNATAAKNPTAAKKTP